MWSRGTVVNSAGVHQPVQKLKSVFVFITPLNLVLNQNFLNSNYSKVQRLISDKWDYFMIGNRVRILFTSWRFFRKSDF